MKIYRELFFNKCDFDEKKDLSAKDNYICGKNIYNIGDAFVISFIIVIYWVDIEDLRMKNLIITTKLLKQFMFLVIICKSMMVSFLMDENRGVFRTPSNI